MLETVTAIVGYFLQFKYIVLFVSIFFTASFVPVSSELLIVSAGVLVASGEANFLLMFIVSLVANILGDVFGYITMRFFGNKYGRGLEGKSKTFHSIGTYLRKRPIVTTMLSRFLGFGAGQVNFLAGLTRTPIRLFLLGDVIGNTICVGIYLITGYLAERSEYSVTTIAAIIAGVLLFFVLLSFIVGLYIQRKAQAQEI